MTIHISRYASAVSTYQQTTFY